MSTRMSGGRRRRRVLLALMVVALVLVGLYASAYASAKDRLPQGSRIEGIDVGGLTPEEARRRLDVASTARSTVPVELRAGGRTLRVVPRDVGLEIDAEASVDQVPVGSSLDPRDLWGVLTGRRDFDAIVVAPPAVDRALAGFAERILRPAVDGGVGFEDGRPVVREPRAGARLDVASARAAVIDAYLSRRGTARLGLDDVPPALTQTEVDRAVSELAEPAMSAPVVFEVSGRRVRLSPGEYDERLTLRPRDGRLVPRVDRRWLARRLTDAVRASGAAPRDATVRIVDGRPRVVAGRRGAVVDEQRAATEFLRLVAADAGDRAAAVPTVEREPRTTTAEARGWGIRREVSSFTTYYPHADYRNVNIGRAAEIVDGTVLEPGETFSLNRTVGERTAENGFARGFIISNGIFKEDFGGGVSQVATTLFNAAFFAGLEDVEHKPHSFYIDRYPVGREATVAWPTVDLKFRNDTDHGVLIDTAHTPSTPASSGALTVRMWSTKVWDIGSRTSPRYAFTDPETRYVSGEDCVPNEGYGGFQVDVTRVFRLAGQRAVRRTERMHTVYTPSDSVICR